MKTTKRIICIFLALTFALLVGCKDNSLPVDEVIAKTDEHRVFRSGDNVYFEFLKDPDSESPNILGHPSAGIKFSSLTEMRRRILENDFNYFEKVDIIKGLANGETLRPMFDVEALYTPICPEGFRFDSLCWPGSPRYVFCFVNEAEDQPLRVYFTYYEDDYYEEAYTRECVEFFDSSNDKYVKNELNEMTTEYLNDNTRYLLYIIEDNERTIQVKEKYLLSSESDSALSETVPSSIEMYVVQGDVCYTISFNLQYFTTRPTEEWLLSFGMEPYVPEEAE